MPKYIKKLLLENINFERDRKDKNCQKEEVPS